ncbi:MAG: DNA repair protein RecN [Chloroflexota bacterium]
MLAEISIDNFAIIDHLTVNLDRGFNVITGETGAGKSIVIDAVGALLGGKTSAESVRVGTEQAHVEGIFVVNDPLVLETLTSAMSEHGLAVEDDGLILSRDIYRSGRSVARINGRAVPASVLQQVGQYLVDIHGQSEHLSLLRSSYQLDLLDDYAGVQPRRADVAGTVARLRQVRREIDRLTQDERELARRADLLRFQVDEIEAAGLHAGEEEDLDHERRLLANAEKLAAAADSAYQTLYAGSDDLPSAVDRLGEASAALGELAALDPSMAEQLAAVESALFQAEEAGRTMRAYRDGVEFNPARLQVIGERLDLIFALKRKYGNSIADVIAYGQQAAVELDSLTHSEERREELAREEADLVAKAGLLAGSLSRARKEAAAILAQSVECELGDLNMKGSRFEVSIVHEIDQTGVPIEEGGPRYACDTTGVDRVGFMISPNLGEPLKPLAKTASGGEMSRLLLALKTVLSGADRIPTLIFDEIDVGVGGRSGRLVGEKLCSLGSPHQVISVTHLPQIACYADAHFRIAKAIAGDRTVTRVSRLTDDERVNELAAMLAGSETSETARNNAAEMLQGAGSLKQTMRALAKRVPA